VVQVHAGKVLHCVTFLCRNHIFGNIHSWQVRSNVDRIHIKKASVQHKMSKKNQRLQIIFVMTLQGTILVIENQWRARWKS
jgi:hypothetical protein